MGAYLSEPMTAKESEDGEGNKLRFGACSMQGWRVSQEDAHNCIAKFDENSSLFAVYDGHGGAEVAIYLSKHLPEVLKSCESYKKGEFLKALEECYLKIDASIKSPEVIKEIQQLAKRSNPDSEEAQVDYEEENVGALYEEATMPLDKLVAKYQSGSNEDQAEAEGDSGCKPGSSKSLSASSSSEPGPSSSKSASSSSSPGPSSSSAACSSSAVSSSSMKADAVNGEVNENSMDTEESTPADSSAGNSESTKTDAEATNSNQGSEGDSSLELIVEGKKIELQKAENIDAENEAVAAGTTGAAEKHPSNGINGNGSENNEKENVTEEKSQVTKVEADSSDSDKPSSVNGNANNGNSDGKENEDLNKTGDSTSETPRRKKVHPVPIAMEDAKPERRSPRKNQRAEGFELLDSDESDEDDEDPSTYGDSDSNSDLEEGGEEESSGEDEDDEDDYEEEEEDERFLSDIQEPGYDSGSTAVVCFMKWDGEDLSLWVANAGDSRCVVCREGKAIDMSHDHKPELDVEAQRIVKAGGKVTEDGRVNGGLNLSRALGDHSYKQNTSLPPEEQMISPLPSIEHIVLNPSKDKFLVLACDGIWNSMSSQEVVNFVQERLDESKPLSKICEELFDSCLAPDTCGDGTGCDNMTAIIVRLSDVPEVFSGSKRKLSADAEPETVESTKKSKTDTGDA